MPQYTVSLEMDFEADNEEHAALLGYKALLNNPLPLYYQITSRDGGSKNVVLNREAAEAFRESDDFTIAANTLLSIFAKGDLKT